MAGLIHYLPRRLSLFLRKQSPATIVTGACVMVFAIGYFDYLTGYDISLFVFYSLPVFLAVWYTNRRQGIFIALLSAVVWWWSDAKAGHHYPMDWIKGWDMAVRLFFFLFVATSLSTLKHKYELAKRSQRLERQLIKISEREQRRIGQELHDGLCQYFAAVSCAASSLADDLDKQSAPGTDAAAEISKLLSEGVIQTRNLAHGLLPVRKDESGLESALYELATSASRLFNINCRFEPERHVTIRDTEAATHLYRITQEALNNATRHGHANVVSISLTGQAGRATLAIRDNGRGLPKREQKPDGMGLEIMDYRAHLIGGTLDVRNQDAGGVVVTCTFPLDAVAGRKKEKPADHAAKTDLLSTAARQSIESRSEQDRHDREDPASS